VITKCPHCNAKFKVRDEYKGRKTKCSKCKQLFTIDEFIAKPVPSTRVKCIPKKKCIVCGESFSDDEILQTINNNFICKRCFKERQEQQTSGTGKKKILFLSVAGVLILVIGIAFYFFFLDTDRPSSVRESQTAETGLVGWPFKLEIPEGFAFDRRKEWKDRTFWILRGEQFGEARETLIVVKSNPETLSTDIQRAPYWAVELCVDCPLGESLYNQREILNEQKYAIALVPRFDNQVLFSPGQRSELAKVAGLTGSMDNVMRSIPLEGLGRPKDYVPGTVNAWAGSCDGTLLVVAWSGDSYKKDRIQHMLAELCYGLRLKPEERFKAPDKLREWLDFDKVIPNSYQFERRMKYQGMTLWVFKSRELGAVQETLLVVDWRCSVSSPLRVPFVALSRCAQWAGEVSVGKTLSKINPDFTKDMSAVVKDGEGQYRLSHFLEGGRELSKGTSSDVTLSFSLKDLITIGEHSGKTRRLSVETFGEPGRSTLVGVSAVSRAIRLESEGCRYLIFGGATVGTEDQFWEVIRVVDELVNAYVDLMNSEVLQPASSKVETTSTSKSTKGGGSAKIPADGVYNSNAGSGGSYTDVIHGFFQVEPLKGFRIEEDRNRTTTRLDDGTVVPCSRIRFVSGKARIGVVTRKSFRGTIDEDLEVVLRNLRSAGGRIERTRFITVDGVKGAEVLSKAAGYQLLTIKYKKHGLDHAITMSCSPSDFSNYRPLFVSFLRSYRSLKPE
jgi:predicted Zn finger-like uncharacterized protein